MSLQKKFGFNVRQVREAQNWPQERLASESGLDRSYISGIECGTRNPTLLVVQRIASALKVTAASLLEDKRK